MPSDKKPVYIPRQKRLHGAFRGGFSAGYFNTVGSREGWTPRTQQDDEEKVQQRPEDFMDEQDHNEWGGPSSVNPTFQIGEARDQPPTLALLTGALVPQANIGRQLLRALGWRESSSSAFVQSTKNTQDFEENSEEQLYLSARRLRKIQLSQVKVEIPQPKLDTSGLGFQRFENAPEFQRDREKRRNLKANHRRKVYRVADVIGGGSREPFTPTRQNDDGEDDPYVSFETENDFIGNKSVGGFALHEDEDDAYDDEEDISKITGKVNIDRDNYDHVAYEHHDSSDEEKQGTLKKQPQSSKGVAAVLGSVLSAWASASVPEENSKKQLLTSDGRPVLPGFVLGGTDSSFSSSHRFPGPDIPEGYEVNPHVFSVEDHPLVIQALSHAEKLAASEEQKMAIVENALKSNEIVNKPSRLNQKGIFEGLRANMSSRFVTSMSTLESQDDPAVGLVSATEYGMSQTMKRPSEVAENADDDSAKKVTITRTVEVFVPGPLLCKRFQVNPLENTKSILATQPIESRTREEAYFQDEILAKVKVAPPNDKSTHAQEGGGRVVDGLGDTTRPSMEVYKSIFNVQDSPGSSEDENDWDNKHAHFNINSNSGLANEGQIILYDDRKRIRTHRRTPSSSDTSSSDRSYKRRKRELKHKKSKKGRKERRTGDDHKRRKGHKKSSKRKRDRDRLND